MLTYPSPHNQTLPQNLQSPGGVSEKHQFRLTPDEYKNSFRGILVHLQYHTMFKQYLFFCWKDLKVIKNFPKPNSHLTPFYCHLLVQLLPLLFYNISLCYPHFANQIQELFKNDFGKWSEKRN